MKNYLAWMMILALYSSAHAAELSNEMDPQLAGNSCYRLYFDRWSQRDEWGVGSLAVWLPVVGFPSYLIRRQLKEDKIATYHYIAEAHSQDLDPDARLNELIYEIREKQPAITQAQIIEVIRQGLKSEELCVNGDGLTQSQFHAFVFEKLATEQRQLFRSDLAVPPNLLERSDDLASDVDKNQERNQP